MEEKLAQIQTLLYDDQIQEAKLFFAENREQMEETETVLLLDLLFSIYEMERAEAVESIFAYSRSLEVLGVYCTKLRFLLWHYDFEVYQEGEAAAFAAQNRTSYVLLWCMIDRMVIHKAEVVNRLACELFACGDLEYALSLLLFAYSHGVSDDKILYDIAYLLHVIGAEDKAMFFLEQIESPELSVTQLKDEIRTGATEYGE